MSAPASLLVVGGGPAGYTLVDQLRQRGYRGELTLVDPAGYPMDRPPLSKEFLQSSMPLEELRFRDPAWYEERAVSVVFDEVEEICGRRTSDDSAGWVAYLVSGGSILSDGVVLATGTRPVVPQVPGTELPGVVTFYSALDAQRVRSALVPGAAITVIGGGLVGAEVAAEAAARGADVTLVNPSEPAGTRSFGAHAAARLEEIHVRRGVTLVRGRPASFSVEDDARGDLSAPLTVTLESGESWAAELVLLATGAEAADTLARDAGASVAPDGFGGVLVSPDGHTSLPNLWAVGDVARRVDEGGDPLPSLAHWEPAMHSAEDAAAALMGHRAEERGTPWFWSDRHGHHVEVVGLPDAMGDVVVRPGRREDGPPAGVFTLDADGLLLAAVTIDDSRLARAARRLIDKGAPVDPAALADPEVSARELLVRRDGA